MSIVCKNNFGIIYLTLTCNKSFEKQVNPSVKNMAGTENYYISATEINA